MRTNCVHVSLKDNRNLTKARTFAKMSCLLAIYSSVVLVREFDSSLVLVKLINSDLIF